MVFGFEIMFWLGVFVCVDLWVWFAFSCDSGVSGVFMLVGWFGWV